jgi:hypothetical protein
VEGHARSTEQLDERGGNVGAEGRGEGGGEGGGQSGREGAHVYERGEGDSQGGIRVVLTLDKRPLEPTESNRHRWQVGKPMGTRNLKPDA